MTSGERQRLHQLHPAKLVTDWGTAAIAGGLLWAGRWGWAVGIGVVPSVVASAIFMSGALDEALRRIRDRTLARAISEQLSASVNTVRFAGLALSWAACGWHEPWLIPAGVLVIAGGWTLAWTRATARTRDARA